MSGSIICGFLTVSQVFMYALLGSPWSLVSAVICGLMTVFCLAMEAL